MKRFIITEEEKKEILQQYNLLEQAGNDLDSLIGPMANQFAIKASQMSPFILGATGNPIDGYVKFMTLGTDLQPTIEKMFRITCKSSEDIEKSERTGEFGYAGKCLLILRLLTKILNIYVVSKYSPIRGDRDNKQYYPVIDLINTNNELKQIASQVLRGQNQKGEKYNPNVIGGVYITPNELEGAITSIYNKQRDLFD